MKILVTGGAGYLGSILVRKLIEEGHEITIFDKLIYGFNSIKNIPVKLQDKDVRNIDFNDIKDQDIIIHLASIVGDAACDLDPKETIEINYEATRNIAEICSKTGKKLFYSSTCSVYGENPGRISKEEDKAIKPISLYGKTKLKSEEAIKKSGCNFVIFRLGTLFGFSFRMRFDLAINLFIAKALKKEPIVVFGGEQIRPFLHVKDAADAFIFAIKNDLNGIFNVAWKNMKILDVAEKICIETNARYKVSEEIVDRRNYRVDCEKIRKLGFIPRKCLKYAIGEIETAYNLGFWKNYKEPIYSNHKYLFENMELMKKVYTFGPLVPKT